MLDFLISLLLLVFSPFLIWLVDEKQGLIRNAFSVMMGSKTWVSYGSDNTARNFPELKLGILTPFTMRVHGDQSGSDLIKEADFYYARDYSIWKDLNIILANYKKLGKK